MTSRLAILWIAVIAITGAALACSGRAARGGAERLADAREQSLRVRAQLDELQWLRAAAPPGDRVPTAPEELPGRVSGIMRASGLPPTALASFDGGGIARHGDHVTRRVSLVLQQVTLPQAGRFLSEWRLAEPQWVVASADLSPRGEPPAAGGDLPLQAVIALESTVRAPGDRP